MDKAANYPKRERLGEVVVRLGMVTPEQVEEALQIGQRDNKMLGQVLVGKGQLTSTDLATALSIQLGVPLIDLKRHKVHPEALKLVPEQVARKYNVLPLDIIDGSLAIVMENVMDVQAIDDISAMSKMRVEPMMGFPDEIRRAIDRNYSVRGETEDEIATWAAVAEEEEPEELIAPEAEAPVLRNLNLLIQKAVRNRASDVHIEPQEDRLQIRFRIDGVLQDMMSLPLNIHAALISRLKIMGLDLAGLGFSPGTLERYQQILKLPFGMILFGGPTGVGKTTTLYASINQLNRMERNIMTIEDPVEYKFEGVNQFQVNPKADIGFANSLRAFMRLDPDVILVGEIRDSETARVAIQAALTGHLVFSSVHANDAVGVMYRLVDLGVEPFLLCSALAGTVSQRIVRRICPHCQVSYEPTMEERMAYQEEMGEPPPQLYKGTGCNVCSDTGYFGRAGIFEVLVPTEEVKQLLLGGASAAQIRDQAIKDGMVPLLRDGMLKVKEGITTVSEVLRNVFY